MKASPPPQGRIQPLASQALLQGAFTSFPYLAWDLVKAAKEERVLPHCSAHLSWCSWHNCQNVKVKAQFLRVWAEGTSSSLFLYFPVGKRMSNSPP